MSTQKIESYEVNEMDFIMNIIIVFDIVLGIGSLAYIVGSMFVVFFQKLFRKVKYGISLYD